MKKPKKDEWLQVRVDRELLRMLRAIAAAKGVGVSWLVRDVLRHAA